MAAVKMMGIGMGMGVGIWMGRENKSQSLQSTQAINLCAWLLPAGHMRIYILAISSCRTLRLKCR